MNESRRSFLGKIFLGTAGAVTLLSGKTLSDKTRFIEKSLNRKSPVEITGDESFWSGVRNAFELDKRIINLNNGGVSPTPSSVHNSFKENLDYTNKLPAYNLWIELEPEKERVREKIAGVLGCSSEEIAITRNTSESLENIQFGIDLRKNEEVITTSQDYHRMMNAWHQYSARNGVTIVDVSYETPLRNPQKFVDAIIEKISSRTRLIHISHIVYLTGQILPVRQLCDIAHQNNIEVICDGAHSFNHIPFKIDDLGCDYFGTSLHKWTYAPVGSGFLYVNKKHIGKVWPLMAAPANMKNDIRKFEEIGTHQAAYYPAIIEALDFNRIIDIERKTARLRYLNKQWINQLKSFNNVNFMINVADDSQWCGIVTVHVENTNPNKTARYLFDKKGILTAPIVHKDFKGIRITPNIYTPIEHINYFADVMTEIAEGKITEVFE